MAMASKREENERILETASVRLQAIGQRFTGARRSLVSALLHAERPLTITEIVERPGNPLPQSSAYRNLADLERARVVRRIHTADQVARYELAEDLVEHHHHLVCARCGSVTDVDAPTGFERTVHRALDQAAARHGFTATGHRLDLLGLCRDCS